MTARRPPPSRVSTLQVHLPGRRPDGYGFCFACFTGEYPVDAPEGIRGNKLALEE